MLQEELTFGLISQETGIAYEQIPRLWNAFLLQLEQRLGNASCIDFTPLGFWSLKLREEFIADIQGEQSFIIPPRLVLDITQEPTSEAKAIYKLEDCLDAIVLATKLSEKTVVSFLSKLADIIDRELQAKKEFYCPQLGLLSPTTNDSAYKLTLEEAFAESLNKPFAMFSPIELQALEKENTKLKLRSFSSLDEIKLPLECYYGASDEVVEDGSTEEGRNESSGLVVEEANAEFPPITESEDLPLSKTEDKEEPLEKADTTELGTIDEAQEGKNEDDSRRKGCVVYFFVLALLLALSYILFLAYQRRQESDKKEQIKKEETEHRRKQKRRLDSLEQVKRRDSLKQLEKVKEAPIEEITIRSGHTLRKIALQKYGHKVFWVYIYEENKAIIKNYNNIPIGTKLKLPPKGKYGIDPNDNNSIKKALEIEYGLFNQSK